VNGRVVTLRPGARLMFDGDAVQVTQWDGAGVTIRNDRTGRFVVLTLSRLVGGARSLELPGPADLESVGVTLAGLTKDQLALVATRAGHVREVVGLENSAMPRELALRLQPRSTHVTNLNGFRECTPGD